MSTPVQGIVKENWANYPHSDVTDQIVEYRKGQISFAKLYDQLTERDYADPTHYQSTGGRSAIDEADHHEPGTIGELTQANALGLLTDIEYEAILSGALRAHGA